MKSLRHPASPSSLAVLALLPTLASACELGGSPEARFDLAVVRSSQISLSFGRVNPAGDIHVAVSVYPGDTACYEPEPDLTIAINGLPPMSLKVVEPSGHTITYSNDCQARYGFALIDLPAATSTLAIEFRQGGEVAVADGIAVPVWDSAPPTIGPFVAH